ncbi:MAG TPA: 2'-5' RNA ligase family protein [Sphingomonas sp.]|jgi:hypothetical protein|uniref:2'-5' RNA ligase family protein n=1 Tax=Sphingomonas sp. TaxID=28214 RepID=UPI002ED9C537
MIAPLIVSALFGPEDFSYLDGLRRAHFPPERNQISAHLTMFHHLPPSVIDEVERRLADACAGPAPAATLVEPVNLGRGVALKVQSEGLLAIRADLASAFDGMLIPQDCRGWRPHVTIQNKVQPHEARKLLTDMQATWQARPLHIVGLAGWWYRGGPWEPAFSRNFRGRR